MVTKISTIDYYGTESINLNKEDLLVLTSEKVYKIINIIETLSYILSSNYVRNINIPESTEESFIINLYIDEYRIEVYAERWTETSLTNLNNVIRIYRDEKLIDDYISAINFEVYSVRQVLYKKLDLILKNIFCESNITQSLYTIKNKYNKFNAIDILNKFVSSFFEDIDFLSINGVRKKSGYTLSVENQGSGFLSYINLIPMMCESIVTNSPLIIERPTNFHPILKKAIFEILWGEKILHKLLNIDSSNGKIIVIDYEYNPNENINIS